MSCKQLLYPHPPPRKCRPSGLEVGLGPLAGQFPQYRAWSKEDGPGSEWGHYFGPVDPLLRRRQRAKHTRRSLLSVRGARTSTLVHTKSPHEGGEGVINPGLSIPPPHGARRNLQSHDLNMDFWALVKVQFWMRGDGTYFNK